MSKIYNSFLIFFISLYINGQTFSKDTLQIMFVGDIMSHGPQIKAAYQSQTGTYDFSESFKYVTGIFKQADWVIGNLETTLGVKPYSGYPQFSAPPALAKACRDAGINVLATANNHSCDKGKKGIINTINLLDSISVKHLGTYKNNIERQNATPLILDKKGIKVAVLNYTYGTNGLPVPKPAVVNLIDTKLIKKDIVKAKTLDPDIIIAFLHWGQQYKNKPGQTQKQLVDFFHKQGVNIVIGSHPHVIQDVDFERDYINFIDYFTVYSLGNFISNQRTFPRDGSMIVHLSVTKNNRGQVRLTGYKLIPVWVYKYQNKNNRKWHYEILPVEHFKYRPDYFIKNTDYQKMMHYYKHFLKYL